MARGFLTVVALSGSAWNLSFRQTPAGGQAVQQFLDMAVGSGSGWEFLTLRFGNTAIWSDVFLSKASPL
eukprot:3418377-Prorocentrum_lima.AAC.1